MSKQTYELGARVGFIQKLAGVNEDYELAKRYGVTLADVQEMRARVRREAQEASQEVLNHAPGAFNVDPQKLFWSNHVDAYLNPLKRARNYMFGPSPLKQNIRQGMPTGAVGAQPPATKNQTDPAWLPPSSRRSMMNSLGRANPNMKWNEQKAD